MSTADSEVTLASLSDQLNVLTDYFRRRLLNDRAKQTVIDDLQRRLTDAETARSVAALRPLVVRLALAIERIESAPPSEDLKLSVIDELHDILDMFGVSRIGMADEVDPRRHEIVSVTGDGPRLRVGELLRAGYEKDGIVLRPAQVTAIRVPMDGKGGSPESSDCV